jgi:hypothetical protein
MIPAVQHQTGQQRSRGRVGGTVRTWRVDSLEDATEQDAEGDERAVEEVGTTLRIYGGGG